MKRRILLRIGVIVLLCVLILGFMAANSLSVSAGRCLVADNGAVMLILDNSPIVMSARGGAWMFDGLATGDEILVLHNGIEESYPGGTGAYFLVRLGGGSVDDIPEAVIGTLTELGWLS